MGGPLVWLGKPDQQTGHEMEQDKTEVERRAVPGFPGYEVGSDGSLWSNKQQKGGVYVQRHPARTKRGYIVTQLFNETGPVFKYLHHIVLESFVGPCPEGCQACHNDGNPSNNAISNLRWDTPLSNHADKKQHGTDPGGERNGRALLTADAVTAIRKKFSEGASCKALSLECGVSYFVIWNAVKRYTWKEIP